MTTTKDRVERLITDSLQPAEFGWGRRFDEMGADSLDMLELCEAVEDEFEVQVGTHAFSQWKTPGDVLRFAENLEAGEQ